MCNIKNQEQQIQTSLVRYITYQYPDILFCASAGGLHTSIRQAVKMKAAGYWKGFPDLQICEPRSGYHGLFIELKTEKGVVSKEQRAWIAGLEKRGYKAVVCKGFESAKKVLDGYLG